MFEKRHQLSELFMMIDTTPAGASPEALVDNLIRSSLSHVPRLPVWMGLPLSDRFRRGGHGEGDVVGVNNDTARTESFIEVKGPTAAVSRGASCRAGCGANLTQFEHMAHENVPIVVVTTTKRRATHEAAWRDEGLVASARILTFAEVADMIDGCLLASGPFDANPLLRSFFSVTPMNVAA